MRRFASVGVAGAALVLLSVRPAAADAPPRITMGLEYKRDKTLSACPDAPLFRSFLLGAMGYDPIEEIDDPLLAVSLSRARRDVRAEIALRKGDAVVWSDVRKAPLMACPELVEGLAVSLRIHLEKPEDESQQASSPPVPVAAQESKLPHPVEAQNAPPLRLEPATPSNAMPRDLLGQTSETKQKPWSGYAGAQPWVYSWGLPVPVVALTASGGVRWEFLSLSLEGRYQPPASTDTYSVEVIGGSLVPCAHYWLAHACVVGTFGLARVKDFYKTSRATVGLVGGRLGIDIPVWGPLLVRVDTEVSGRVASYLRTIGGIPAKAPSPVTFGGGIGMFAHF